jgi:pimeloyl-ACP methyl ester carboxylesterase
MITLLKLSLVVLLVFALLGWMARFWRRVFSFDPGYSQVHLVQTEDRWRIGLYRYLPERQRHPTPVILCHGLGANRFNFDLGPEKSLARHLQRLGFDVWVLELRGRGGSRKIGKKQDAYRTPYIVDDYVRKDAPAALAHVRKETGADRVHWVGHSMGGLILYGLLQGEHAGAIESGVAVASPGDFRNVKKIPLLFPMWRLFRHLPRMHQGFLAAAFAPLLPCMPDALKRLVYNPGNVERFLIHRAVCHLISDVSRGEMLQFYDCMQSRDFRTLDGTHSYQEGFATMKAPLLLMAGTQDALCPPQSARSVYEAIKDPRKELIIFGKAYGQQEEYGHGDLLIGTYCEAEVYPHIVRWLETKRDPGPA